MSVVQRKRFVICCTHTHTELDSTVPLLITRLILHVTVVNLSRWKIFLVSPPDAAIYCRKNQLHYFFLRLIRLTQLWDIYVQLQDDLAAWG